jgi:citrate synthase
MTGSGSPSKGLDDVVIDDSSISLVEGDRGWLVYRGFDITEVVRAARFEDVVHLLVFGEPPGEDARRHLQGALASRRALAPELERVESSLPTTLAPLDALRTLVSAMGSDGPGYPPTFEDGLSLIARCPTLLARYVRRTQGLGAVAPRSELGHAENFLWMLTGELPSARPARALERYFLLLADHGMNASTLALRVAISTQADLVSGAVAALATLKGPAHGGAPSRVSDMLDAVAAPENARAWIADALARGQRLYGFGHRAYKVEDPRALLLREIAKDVADPKRLELAHAVEAAALAALRERKPHVPLYTNVEFYAAVVLEAVGLPRELFTPAFALARTAGWTAHALEQASSNRLIRPDVRYVGPPRGRRWPEPSA